jgi:hypothetical protein
MKCSAALHGNQAWSGMFQKESPAAVPDFHSPSPQENWFAVMPGAVSDLQSLQ